MEYDVRIYAIMPVSENHIEADTAEEAAEKARRTAEFPNLDDGWPTHIAVMADGKCVHSEDWQRSNVTA